MRKQIQQKYWIKESISIEKVAEQFLVEGKEIENRDGPYTADDYIPTPKDAIADLLHSYDQSKYHNYDQKEKEEKKGAQNKDDLLLKEKDGKNKGIMNREFHNL